MSTFVLLSVITVALSLMLAWYIWSRMNKTKNHTNFVLLMLSITVWTVFAALEVISMTKTGKILSSQLSYVGIVCTPVFWLFFSFEYSERYDWLRYRWTKFLWVIPAITVIVAFTNEWHGLMWSDIYPSGTFDNILIFKYDRGIWFVVNSFYVYALFLTGLVIIFRKLREKRKLRSYFVVIIGASVPVLMNFLYLTRTVYLDYAPAAFSFTSYCFAWAIITGFLERKLAIAETIHENMEEGIILIDEKFEIISINPSAAVILGREDISAGALTERAIFFWPELKDKFQENANEYFEIKTGEGESVNWYGIHLYSMKKKSSISGWIINLFDITENKRNEEALRRMDKEARKAAEAANVAKSNFLASMSHEIRTPINGIIGFADILSQTTMTREQYDYLGEIRNASDALLYLINDVLDFSKIEADKMDLESVDFDIHNILENSISLIVPGAYNKGIEVHTQIHAGVPSFVKGDPGRLKQVFNNLLGNSLKFTEKGDITVSAECIEENENTATLRFKVSDTGIGMTEEVIRNLFKPFTQADSSTTRKYGGTGLGLAISKRIIEKMGGEISVGSKVNEGTTFTIAVNLEKGNEKARVNYGVINGMKILVVDDNRLNRRIFREYLEDFGCMVIDAANAGEAHEILRRGSRGMPVDMVIMDMNMPDTDGMAFGKIIAEAELSYNPKIILTSSIIRTGDGKKVRDAGFSGYLPKPIRKKELLETISDAAVSKEFDKEPVTGNLARGDAMKKRKEILLAEDMDANRKLASIMLRKIGYECDIAVNGKEAIDACLTKKYDLILMDCQMPLTDGYEASKIIKTEGGPNEGTAIIAMTANALEGDREKCLAAGMDDFISKPVTIKVLEEILRKWMPLESSTYGNNILG